MMPLLPPQQKRVCATDAAIATQRCRTREGEQTHLHPLVNLRERVARHALRLDVLRTLREREELLIVAKRLLEVLEVGELLVGLTELVLRLALLGGVATRARSRKALFAGFQRRGRLTSRLALRGLRLLPPPRFLRFALLINWGGGTAGSRRSAKRWRARSRLY